MARRAGLPWDVLHRVALYSAFVGLLGAKLFGLFELRHWPGDLTQALQSIGSAGLVFYGAPLTALPFAAWRLRTQRLPVWLCLDIAAIGFAIGGAIGRIGCFLGGCCHGTPTSSPFGITPDSAHAPLGMPLHPVQLYESLGMGILFLLLLYRFSKRAFDGEIVMLFLFGYATLRFVVEMFRGDADRGYVVAGLSTSQTISIVLFLAVGLLLAWRRKC